MTEFLYGVRIKHVLVDSERVYFSTKQKKYTIYGSWLVSEDGVRCKLIYFIIVDDIITIFTEGECRLMDDWVLLNKG